MKSFKIFSLLTVALTFTLAINAQTKTESIPVSGSCGMCKTKIEKAAKEAGASKAEWDVEKKSLTVTYNSKSTNAAKIQEKIAGVGYDTRDVKATDASYDKLHGCCKYDRVAATPKKGDACCSKEGEKEGECHHDQK